MIEVTVKNILFFAQKSSPGYTLFLQPVESEGRSLPIVVGQFEAQAIALALEEIKLERPMTHDLLSAVIDSLTDGLESVVIDDIKEGTFYAKLLVRDGLTLEAVDARPSDAIALALRAKVPIKVKKELFDRVAVAIPLTDGGASQETNTSFSQHVNQITRQAELRFDLEKDLREAVLQEDYEKAALLRDRLEDLASKES